MSFCSFTKDGVKEFTTDIENCYITDFLTEADGDAVRVYVYGLYVCKNVAVETSFSSFCEDLHMSEDAVKDCFRYWEDFACVSVLSDDPFTVKYLPLTSGGKPRKFKAGKYDEFNKSLQTLITERMISTNEYADYFSVMEDFSVSPEAMLMICKYCVDLKGANVGSKYILAVARDFAQRGITTVELIEDELSDYFDKSNDIQKVLTALSLRRKPEVDDLNYYNKWVKNFGFEPKIIIFTAKTTKSKSVLKLDEYMNELYGAKAFTEKQVNEYLENKVKLTELAKNVCRSLSVYCEVIKPVVDTYVSPWISMGYDDETLIFIANHCFRHRKRTLEDMNEVISTLYKKGLVAQLAIADYLKRKAVDDDFIKTLLSETGMLRSPNDWDRNNLASWRDWGFSEEMIKEAAKFAAGKNNPMIYMNTVLSTWKTKGYFTVEDLPKQTENASSGAYSPSSSVHFANERTYTKEELDKLYVDIDDVDF